MANVLEITSLEETALDVYARLTEAQLRARQNPEKGLLIAEGTTVIRHALDAGLEPVSFLMERQHILGKARPLIDEAGDTPVYTADSEILARLTGFALTRGVLCAMRRPAPRDAEEILAGAKRVCVMENVADPTNVGAIFRSAAALGVDAVLLTAQGSDPLYRRALRVSMGTIFQVPWTIFPEGDWQELLRSLGFRTVAMALRDDSFHIADERIRSEAKLAIVLGTEGDGLRNDTIARCDYTVKIPMTHGVDSLNVAAASAVAFYQLALMR